MHMVYEISYGIDFDPLTNNLWDTENGPTFGDEINLVEPGFNSGWRKIQGIWNVTEMTGPDGRINLTDLDNKSIGLDPRGLETFEGRGIYSSPEFTWFNSTSSYRYRFSELRQVRNRISE